MFMFLVAAGAIIGAIAGFLLSRADATHQRSTQLKTILISAAVGGLAGGSLWLSFWLLAAALRVIFWIVLLIIVVGAAYFGYKWLQKKSANRTN